MAFLLSLIAVIITLVSFVSYAATSGDFNILSFNVAGLPAILNSNNVPGNKATKADELLYLGYDELGKNTGGRDEHE
ncbi:hypothetical protein N431DRAFT_432977 [Stipitochalara longipes BDJ]|nr:hypothetical protein N431DRAFT_432977 [Stipitochalara longipes BDJ]